MHQEVSNPFLTGTMMLYHLRIYQIQKDIVSSNYFREVISTLSGRRIAPENAIFFLSFPYHCDRRTHECVQHCRLRPQDLQKYIQGRKYLLKNEKSHRPQCKSHFCSAFYIVRVLDIFRFLWCICLIVFSYFTNFTCKRVLYNERVISTGV